MYHGRAKEVVGVSWTKQIRKERLEMMLSCNLGCCEIKLNQTVGMLNVGFVYRFKM